MHSPATAVDWPAVVEEHRSWITRVITARTGGVDAVDDVLQEVALAVTVSRDRPTAPDEVAPWLCKIVVRQCAMVVRNRVRQQRKLNAFQQSRESRGAKAEDPVFWILHTEQRAILREELAAMEPQSRDLLLWKFLQGLRYEEIGARLGISRHAAEYRVVEARKQLRRRLQRRGIEGDNQT